MRAIHSNDPFISSLSLQNRVQRKMSDNYPEEVKLFFEFEQLNSNENVPPLEESFEDIMDTLDKMNEPLVQDMS